MKRRGIVSRRLIWAFVGFLIMGLMGCSEDIAEIITDIKKGDPTTPLVVLSSHTNNHVVPTTVSLHGTVYDKSEVLSIVMFSTLIEKGADTNLSAATFDGGELLSYSLSHTFIKSGWHYIWVAAQNEWSITAKSIPILINVVHGTSTNKPPPVNDTTPPVVIINSPSSGQSVGSNYTFTGTVSDDISGVNNVYVKLDTGMYGEATLINGTWSADYTLSSTGQHTNYVYAVDKSGNTSIAKSVWVDYQADMPSIQISSPANGITVKTPVISVSGSASVSGGTISKVQIKVNTSAYSDATGTTSWSESVTLWEGQNTIYARAITAANKTNTSAALTVHLDSVAPTVNISYPTAGLVISNASITLSGTASDDGSGLDSVHIAINDDGFSVATGTANWSKQIALNPDTYLLKVYARDSVGNIGATNTVSFTVVDPSGPEDFKVYCKARSTWTGVRVHYWGGTCGASAWPGLALVDEGNGWYSYIFDTGTNTSLLFNNAGAGENPPDGEKTPDLSAEKGGPDWYWTNGQWYDDNPEGPQPPAISAAPGGGNFYATTHTVTLYVSGDSVISSRYTTDGSDPKTGSSYANGFSFDIGTGMSVGNTKTLRLYATNANGESIKSYLFTKIDEPTVNSDIDSLVIYQVMVEAFQDGDPGVGYGTGYGPSHHNGDIKGIRLALPYIKSLGVNAIWLTPIFNSDGWSQLDATGYFTRNYFEIDPKFGTYQEAKDMVDAAHALGMYVFFDGVFGHHKGGVPLSPSGYWPDGNNDPVSYPGQDNTTLNFYKEVATYWIDELEIDGWRLDQAYQVPINYWDDIRNAVEAKCAERAAQGKTWGTLGYMVGEIWKGEGEIQSTGYGTDGLHSCFDFPLRYRLVQVLAQEESGLGGQPASALKGGYDTHGAYASHAHPNMFVGNHDLVRFGDLIQRKGLGGTENPGYWNRHKAMFTFMATYTGPITIYYNDEIGYEVPNDGSFYDDNVARSSGKITGLNANEMDLTNYVGKLMSARATYSALWKGTNTFLIADQSTHFAMFKDDGTTDIVYVLNTSTSTIPNISISQGTVGGTQLVDVIDGATINASGGNYSISVDGLTGRIFKVE